MKMIKTYGIYVNDYTLFGLRTELAEFADKKEAEKLVEYPKGKYGGKYRIIDETVYESFDEFLKKVKLERGEKNE